MARLFDSTAEECLEFATPPVTAVPITIACFMRRNTSSTSRTLVAFDSASTTDRFRMGISDSNEPFAQVSNGSTTGTAIHATQTTLGQWHHVCSVFSSTSSRKIYLDGGTPTTHSAYYSVSGINGVRLGAWQEGSSGLSRFFSGDLAEVAVWDVALSDAEVAQLAQGHSPLSLTHRLRHLVIYQDLVRALNRPRIGPDTSAYGTDVSEHCRMYPFAGAVALGKPSGLRRLLCVAAANTGMSGVAQGRDFLSGTVKGQTSLAGGIAGEVFC